MEGHIEIQIDGKEYRAPSSEMTGLQIKELAAIAAGDQLFERETGGDVPIFNDTAVTVHSGLKFFHLPGSITAG